MRKSTFGVEPGWHSYMLAARVGWWISLAAALVLFALVPHWYYGLPSALLGFWLTNGLCGLLWYEVRELLTCDDLWHRRLAGMVLIIVSVVGTTAFCLIPNWTNFDFNGHPSLVALVGSLALGAIAFVIAGGLIAGLCIPIKLLVLRIVGRSSHGTPP